MKTFRKYYLRESVDDKSFLDAFQKGFEVEKEHSKTVNDNLITIARITLDHLEEDIEYYKKLEKVEK